MVRIYATTSKRRVASLDYVVPPQGANGVHLPDPVSCKTPDRDNDSKLPIHKGLVTLRPYDTP